MPKDNEKIRERAYEIWHREGRQHGQAEAHWAQAERELGGSEVAAPSGTKEPAAPVPQAKDPMPNKKANGAAISAKSAEGGPRKRRGAQPVSQG